MLRKWQGAIPVAGIAAAAALAFPGSASAAVQSQINGTTLDVTADAADAITIACDGADVTVNGGVIAGASCAQITAINVTATGAFDNVITLTGVTDAAYTALAKTTIKAGAGDDRIFGSERVDEMHGEAGNDQIIGDDNPAGTRDAFLGEAGDDLLIWRGGEDDDTMDGGDGADTIQVNGAGVAEAFTVKPSATAGRVSFDRLATPGPGPFNLDIGTAERLELKAGGGDDTLVSDAGLDALGFKLDVTGGDGNDNLDGGDAADTIAGEGGNDTITLDDNPPNTRDIALGGDGDDTMIWNGGDDDDVNDGGAGNDTVTINGAPVDEEFTIKPSPVAGRVLFDRLATPGPGPFSVDIGTSEQLRLEANAGNDRIKGAKGVDGRIKTILNAGDGDDRIKGTDAVDTINAGTGDDFVNSIDKAEDTVSCDQGIDLALVDRRDFLRQCELVIGGRPRVALKGRPQLDGNRVALRLKCVATEKCKSVVKLKRNGKPLGRGKATLKRGRSKDVEVVLNKRGRRTLSEGDRVRVQIVSRDKQGNGWRSAETVRLG